MAAVMVMVCIGMEILEIRALLAVLHGCFDEVGGSRSQVLG